MNLTRPQLPTWLWAPACTAAVIGAFLICFIAACGPKATRVVGSPKGYDLNHPKVLKLTPLLNEISGLYYYRKDTSLFSIIDEDGYLYKLYPYRPDSIMRWRFAGHGDYEDLSLLDSTFYILQSNGNVLACNVHPGGNVLTVEYHFPETGKEFESIYYDTLYKRMILVCKDCDEGKRSLSTYSFDPVTHQYADGPFKVNMHEIAVIAAENSMKFKPSAAAIHPLTGDLYLLSSVNKLLVVVDRNGAARQAYPLRKDLYKQPEGLAFGPDGTLFISNEYAKQGAPTILIIPYRPNRKS